MTKRPGEAASDAERILESAIARIPEWQGRAVRYGPVAGGITNANFRVEVEAWPHAFFIKVPGRGTELFIDRAASIAASRQAHALGLPECCLVVPNGPCMPGSGSAGQVDADHARLSSCDIDQSAEHRGGLAVEPTEYQASPAVDALERGFGDLAYRPPALAVELRREAYL